MFVVHLHGNVHIVQKALDPGNWVRHLSEADIALNDGKDGSDSRIRFASAMLSDSISLRSGFSPRWIFSTTFHGIGGRAGESIWGAVLRCCGVDAGSC